MKTTSDFLDRYFLPAFRWIALLVSIVIALNFVTFWWHWEVRLPSWGAIPSRLETLSARLTLFWTCASLAFGAAFFDLLKVPTKVRRRSIALFSLAMAFAAVPYLARHFFLS